MRSMFSRLSSTFTWLKVERQAGTFSKEDITRHRYLTLANHIRFHLSGFYVMQESSHLQTRHAIINRRQAL